LARFGAKYQHIREPSNKAAKYVSEKLDFVYIDADHSYLGVLEDLCVWFPKIRNNGFLSGHDYKHPNWPGVAKAVDRFFGMLGLQVNNQGYVWWAQKRQTRMESIFLRLTSIYVRLYKAMHIEFIASKLKFICLRVYFICQMVYKKVRRN
jgi:hypothetical protein